MAFTAPNRSMVSFELYDVTSGNDGSILDNVSILGITSGTYFDLRSDTPANARCPIIIDAGFRNTYNGFSLTMNGTFSDDIRISLNGKPIYDLQRCSGFSSGYTPFNYYGTIASGDIISVDTFLSCSKSGQSNSWSIAAQLPNGGFDYYSGGSGSYFSNPSYITGIDTGYLQETITNFSETSPGMAITYTATSNIQTNTYPISLTDYENTLDLVYSAVGELIGNFNILISGISCPSGTGFLLPYMQTGFQDSGWRYTYASVESISLQYPAPPQYFLHRTYHSAPTGAIASGLISGMIVVYGNPSSISSIFLNGNLIFSSSGATGQCQDIFNNKFGLFSPSLGYANLSGSMANIYSGLSGEISGIFYDASAASYRYPMRGMWIPIPLSLLVTGSGANLISSFEYIPPYNTLISSPYYAAGVQAGTDYAGWPARYPFGASFNLLYFAKSYTPITFSGTISGYTNTFSGYQFQRQSYIQNNDVLSFYGSGLTFPNVVGINPTSGYYSYTSPTGIIDYFGYSTGTSYTSDGSVTINIPSVSGQPVNLTTFNNGSLLQTNIGFGTGSNNYSLITGSPFYPTQEGTPSIIYDKYSVNLPYSSTVIPEGIFSGVFCNVPFYTNFHRLYDYEYNLESGLYSPNQAWVEYNMTGAMNTKQVFAYSISILSSLSGEVLVTNLPPSLSWNPSYQSGYCSVLSLTVGSSGHCQSLPAQDGPEQQCVSGNPVTQAQLDAAISGVIVQTLNEFKGEGDNYASVPNDLTNTTVSSPYYIYTGLLTLNNIVSGDQLCISSYNYDYSGTYQETFNSPAPYPELNVCIPLTGNASGIASAINSQLFLQNYQIWYNYPCTYNQLSGYFENGPLLKATVLNSNEILLTSLRLNDAGNFGMNLITGTHPNISGEIYQYLLPTIVQLQGLKSGLWTILDTETGIQWTSLQPTLILTNPPAPIQSGIPPVAPPPVGPTGIGVSGAQAMSLIYSLTITGLDKCNNPIKSDVDFYQTTVGTSCQQTGDNGSGVAQQILNSIVSGLTPQPPTVQGSFLQTGWAISNTQSYDAYKVVLSGFQAPPQGTLPVFQNQFSIANINLYGAISGYEMYSGQMCLIGANYTASIQGLTTGIISGTVSGYASAATSGVFNYDNMLVTGNPGSNVIFHNATGTPTTPFTGLLMGAVTGTGYYFEEIGGYFYDTGRQGIFFTEPVSGFITGTGFLSGGPYNIVDSGFLQTGVTGSQFVVDYYLLNVSGYVPNVTLPFSGEQGFGYLSGTISALVTSGTTSIQMYVTGVPNVAYYGSPTGFRNATALLNYNNPSGLDVIVINTIPIWYAPNSYFQAPSFYSGVSGLANIINTNPQLFSVSASILNTGQILLTSLISGSSGNLITLDSQGSATQPSFTTSGLVSGKDYYAKMTPTGVYSGFLNTILSASGFYVAEGYGEITGFVDILYFIRSFTGLWNLTTGGLNFLNSGFYSGNTYQSSPVTFTNTPGYFSMNISYNNSPQYYSNDLALLTITGNNFGTGVQLIVSGAN